MNTTPSPLWHRPLSDGEAALERVLDAGMGETSTRPIPVFFRADDIGVPGKAFSQLMGLFVHYKVPLCPAVVPTWLTPARWSRLLPYERERGSLWCWHQHGWRHQNHETGAKKQEFGPGRAPMRIRNDLLRGRRRLESIMGDAFHPVFTPPWNRCSPTTLSLLKDLEYRGLSRSYGSLPEPPEGLPDFQVTVDLHTRKESDPAVGWKNLFSEFQRSLALGMCGVMIHHQRMNPAAFAFLERLLQEVVRRKGLAPVHFKALAGEP